nr:PhnD/SsuA/transferrin family substrate-binding protein [Pararobbsia silviterrae]
MSLPMYNVTPRLRALWRALVDDAISRLREDGFADRVVQPDDVGSDLDALWRRDDLLLSQTCGYPLMRVLPASIQIVGTPIFDADGCDGPAYSSVIVVSEAAFARGATSFEPCRGLRVAVNDSMSNSGMNVLRHAVAPFARAGRFFASVVQTGSHLGSLAALAAGTADIAAIDCVTYAFARDAHGFAHLPHRVLGLSMQTPGLPLIASATVEPALVERLRAALEYALDADAERAATLRLKGFAKLERDDYALIVHLEETAIQLGYPQLA